MRLGFQARCLEVIPETFAAPMVVELWAQLLVVADMRTGQHVTTPARASWPAAVLTCVDYAGSFGIVWDHASDFSTGAYTDHAAN